MNNKNPNSNLTRCAWAKDNDLLIEYHDKEWGVPIHDERLLFEFLNLEGMQAGLSWLTILKKREHYRKSFDNFNAKKIIKYDAKKIHALLQNENIIRNKLKVNAIISNAKALLHMKEAGEDFPHYLWRFVDGKPIQNHRKSVRDIPANTEISDKMSKDLKKRGFKFVGSTICYAFMQAVGMVNDHTSNCFRYKIIK
jgi:DNA-3-methyladenine glycosylase I